MACKLYFNWKKKKTGEPMLAYFKINSKLH